MVRDLGVVVLLLVFLVAALVLVKVAPSWLETPPTATTTTT